uniref:Predicted protein n=1 Tax=Hordeum vulgare subsp. vulgare TaxID=112509 RepID=F2E404_HORVV|nr:predicted protein [Hordeum vulgare subsp. vulgare]
MRTPKRSVCADCDHTICCVNQPNINYTMTR